MSRDDKITDAEARLIAGHFRAAARLVLVAWAVSASLGFAFSFFFGRTP